MEFSVKDFFSKCGQIRSFLGKSKDILKDTLNEKPCFTSSGLIKLAYAKEIQLNYKASPSKGALRKKCSKNMQQIYRRTPMLKCDFALRHGYSPVNLLHIFRTSFYKNTSVRLRLSIRASRKSGGSKEPNQKVLTNSKFQKMSIKI